MRAARHSESRSTGHARLQSTTSVTSMNGDYKRVHQRHASGAFNEATQQATGNSLRSPGPGRLSFAGQDLHDILDDRDAIDRPSQSSTPVGESRPPPPSWASMPNKDQLAILALSRMVDFWQQASLQSYMIHQLRSFDLALPDAVISHQAGILQGSFTGAQIVSALVWGRVADLPSFGRKSVLVIGLAGTALTCIGVGFSNTFWQAAVWRVLGGAINGTVGSARTMVAEVVDKRYHSRAFLLLPLAFNVANILGPVLGGLLCEPVASFPSLFGENSVFGGGTGVQWMIDYPYALPSLLSSVLLLVETAVVVLYLRETLPSAINARGIRSFFREMWDGVRDILKSARHGGGYRPLATSRPHPESGPVDEVEMGDVSREKWKRTASPRQRLPFHRIWTANVLWTLLSVAIFDFHMGAFSSLWIIFLSSAREDPTSEDPARRPPPNHGLFHFTGGLAFQPAALGFSLAILGIVGLVLQLVLYPPVNGKYGLLRCFRYSLVLFPLAYFFAPFLSRLPSTTAPPAAASGFWIWTGICAVLLMQVAARTFALPASIILVNNASPHPSVLGTIHGVGQSTSSMFRTVGPIVGGYWYSLGLEKGAVGLAWWLVAAVSAVGCVASYWVRNGTGHEILLPGEEDEDGEGSGGEA